MPHFWKFPLENHVPALSWETVGLPQTPEKGQHFRTASESPHVKTLDFLLGDPRGEEGRQEPNPPVCPSLPPHSRSE